MCKKIVGVSFVEVHIKKVSRDQEFILLYSDSTQSEYLLVQKPERFYFLLVFSSIAASIHGRFTLCNAPAVVRRTIYSLLYNSTISHLTELNFIHLTMQ